MPANCWQLIDATHIDRLNLGPVPTMAMPANCWQLIDATHIDRLNLGPVPTIQLNWLQPHEGNIIDFLFRARAFQQAEVA